MFGHGRTIDAARNCHLVVIVCTSMSDNTQEFETTRFSRWGAPPLLAAILTLAVTGCFDRAPLDYGRTRSGPGATVRYDLGHKPLPEIPLPNDTATWPDLTSRTG